VKNHTDRCSNETVETIRYSSSIMSYLVEYQLLPHLINKEPHLLCSVYSGITIWQQQHHCVSSCFAVSRNKQRIRWEYSVNCTCSIWNDWAVHNAFVLWCSCQNILSIVKKALSYLLIDECIASISTNAVVWHTCYYKFWASKLEQIPITVQQTVVVSTEHTGVD
jgi:hypothetical protein